MSRKQWIRQFGSIIVGYSQTLCRPGTCIKYIQLNSDSPRYLIKYIRICYHVEILFFRDFFEVHGKQQVNSYCSLIRHLHKHHLYGIWSRLIICFFFLKKNINFLLKYLKLNLYNSYIRLIHNMFNLFKGRGLPVQKGGVHLSRGVTVSVSAPFLYLKNYKIIKNKPLNQRLIFSIF